MSSRDKFEAFVRSRMFTKWDLVRNERDQYKEYFMQSYWEVWQAALATVPPLATEQEEKR